LSTIEKRDEAIDLARYKQAAEEIDTGNRDDALWYKAFAEGGGDDKATKATYIRLRVEQLRRAAVAASAVRVTATQPSPAYTPATPTVKPKPNGAKNLYDVLSITQDASNEQILAGYQTQKNILDARENQDAETKNSLIFIQHAREVLLDPVKRAAYDAKITAEAAQPVKIGREKTSDNGEASASEPLSEHDLYAAYLGEKNQDYYLKKFEKFDQQGDGMHASFNWPALLFGVWPLYRKMYGWFFVFLGIAFLAGIVDWWVVISKMPSLSMLPTIISITYWIFFTAYANSLYHKHVKKKITVAQPIAYNDTELLKILRKEGGVHAWVTWVFLAIFIIGIIAAIAIPAYSDYTKKAKAQVGVNVPHASQELTIPRGTGVSYDQNDPPFKEANSLLGAGKYAEAVDIWRPLAEQGNPRAQYAMGNSYLSGRGVPKDYSEAAKWFRLSAEQGDARAQYDYGRMYATGKGVAENQQEAVKWYRLAAEQGHMKSQLLLGLSYSQGIGVIQDKQEAAEWVRLAAKQGDAGAQSILGSLYQSGDGVPQDYIKAHMWFSIASAIGDKDTASNASKDRDFSERVLPPNDIIRSQQMAKECMNSNYRNCD